MGYRRTGSNIFKTRSNKKMTSLVSKTMAYGMMAPFAALDSMSSSNNFSYIPIDPKHYNPKKHKNGIIIGGILALLCPIVGFITFYYFDWFMFFSVLVSGFIETIILFIILSREIIVYIDNDLYGRVIDYDKFIYEDELDDISIQYCKNENVVAWIITLITILDLYPFMLSYTGKWDITEWGELSIITELIVTFVIIINIFYIVFALKSKKHINELWEIRKRPKIEEKNNTNFNSKSNSRNDKINHVNKYNVSNNTQKSNNNVSNLSIPKINGEYTEEFMRNYGTLRIGHSHAFIEFYFPGPDARYKGTFISINENDIDKYINAYKNNWQTAEKLQVKIFDTPDAKFNQLGEMGMNITVSHNSITLCIDSYHLPICSKKECDDIINHLNIAKHRIKEIRQRLFDK